MITSKNRQIIINIAQAGFAPVILLIVILVVVGGVFAYSKLKTQPLNTSGATDNTVVVTDDDPYVQLGKLLDLGEFSGDGYTVKKVNKSTKVAVFLDKPFEQSQENFTKWLSENGYTNVPKEKIVYFHNP